MRRFGPSWLALLLTSLPVLAAEAEAHEPETFLGLPKWIWMTANLAIFFGLLFKYLGPPIAGALNDRAKEISDNLARAEEQEKEAAEMRASLQSRISELEGEMEEVLARAREDGERERLEILAQAERESARILEQADQEIKYRFIQAKSELTEHTARLATELARKKLESSIGPDDQERIFDENLSRLEKQLQ